MSVQEQRASKRGEAQVSFDSQRDDRPPAADRLLIIIGLAVTSWLAIGAFLYAVAPLMLPSR